MTFYEEVICTYFEKVKGNPKKTLVLGTGPFVI